MVTPTPRRVHGFDIFLNEGDAYLEIVARFPWFNAPLVELVEQMYRWRGRPLIVIDVGAAAGDTVLLLKQRCPNAVSQFLCIEGNEEFAALLKGNMAQFDDVKVVQQVLARERRDIPNLVQHHPGSAAASGAGTVAAGTFDNIPAIATLNVDVLKVDVDGFDGEVLEGASKSLARCHPTVIFEWHPKLIRQTGLQLLTAFVTLSAAGYDRYLWFNNDGTFNHFEQGYSGDSVERMATYLLEVSPRADEHFDIIALHPSHQVNDVTLAVMNFARAASRMG